MYRLDRTQFQMGKVEAQAHLQSAWWKEQTLEERLSAAWYLICTAWQLDYNNPPKMNKSAFAMRSFKQ
jgi:hypothetical protein